MVKPRRFREIGTGSGGAAWISGLEGRSAAVAAFGGTRGGLPVARDETFAAATAVAGAVAAASVVVRAVAAMT